MLLNEPKREAALTLAQRYNYDATHAHQVECLAGTLFMEFASLHGLGREDRKLLEYAAILHDIGYFVTSRSHHRHALQMIILEPMPAFSREEKSVIANLARYHRKALPSIEHTAFAILPAADRQRVLFLAPLLRLADALDRSHEAQVKELYCEIATDHVVLHIGATGNMVEEQAALARKEDMFQKVYGRKVRLRVERLANPMEPELTFAP